MNWERYREELDSGDCIALIWSVHDVVDATRDEDDRQTLTRDQARRVLAEVRDHHDASHGVTWDTLRDYADGLYGERAALEGAKGYDYDWED